MGKMELVVSPLQKMEAIKFNYEELKKALCESLDSYQNLTYTDDTIKDAKEDRAKLNKLAKALNDEKIKIKKEFMVPYDEFEDKIKELITLVEQPTMAIDKQVKAYEEKKKKQKRVEITAIYEEVIAEFKDLITLDSIYDSRWENVTYKIEDIRLEIENRVNKTRTDLKTIAELGSEYEMQLQDVYLRTFDLGQALVEKNRLEKQAELLKKQKEEIVKQDDAIDAIAYAVNNAVETAVDNYEETNKVEETTVEVSFKVITTESKLKALGEYMKANGIKYGRCE